MRKHFWTVVGTALTGAMVILSAFINYNFGHSLGTTEGNARIFGAVSVVAVGVMAVLPLRISMHWEAGRKGRGVLGAGLFGILVAYAVAGSIGFGMQNRSELAGSREAVNAQLKDKIAERDNAVGRVRSLNEDQPATAISAKIEAAKKDRRWDQTQGCVNVRAAASREFCQAVDGLRAQLDVAATAGMLREKIESLNKSIEFLRAQGAGQIADPQIHGFEVLLRSQQDTVRIGLSILLALVIEGVCCLGLLVMAGGRLGGRSGKAEIDIAMTLAEWMGTWLSERVEPMAGVQVSFAKLEEDFRHWSRGRGAPELSSRAFVHLLRAPCTEVGLRVDGNAVPGLRLGREARLLNA